jgi:ketosteroid isomerase-like protein
MEQNKPMKLDAMPIKRFVDGKITEIWEYFDSKQLEQ